MPLSDSKLRALSGKTHAKATNKIADSNGLFVYHRGKTGKLSFVYRYRYAGKANDLVLGTYPVMSLSDARKQACEYKAVLAGGHDPKVQRAIAKNELLEAVTVKQALEYWIDNYVSKNRTNTKIRPTFAKHIYPQIGNIPLDQCTTKAWVKVFDNITNGKYHRAAPKACGYILQDCKQALKYCRTRHFAMSHALDDLTVTDVAEHQNKRDRVLTWQELQDVYQWTKEDTSPFYYRNLVHLLIVFGCRTNEIRLSKVEEWNLTTMVWTVPKEHSKSKKEIIRPIPTSLKQPISQLIAMSKNGYLLNEVRPQGTVASIRLCQKLKHADKWSLHDIRRTFATMLNDAGIDQFVVEQLLGHSLGGVAGIYNRSQHIEKKRAALEMWINKLEQSDVINNVVGIR